MFQGGEMSQNVPERNVPGPNVTKFECLRAKCQGSEIFGGEIDNLFCGAKYRVSKCPGSVIGHVSDTALVCHRSGLPLIKQQQVYGRVFTPPPDCLSGLLLSQCMLRTK